MQELVLAFRNRTVVFGNGDKVIAPHFSGYCGVHASVYHGLTQLAGDFIRVPESLGAVVQQRRVSVAIIPNGGGSGTLGSQRRVSKCRWDDSDLGVFLLDNHSHR